MSISFCRISQIF